MKKNRKRIIAIVVTILLCVICSIEAYIIDPLDPDHPDYIEFSLDWFESWPGSPSEYPKSGLLRIDPSTILTSLDDENNNTFIPDSRTWEELDWRELPLYQDPILWKQSDYMEIASAVNQLAWHDNMSDWNLFFMVFSTKCQDDPQNELTFGMFRYFKTIFQNKKIKYEWREVLIMPDNMLVFWGGNAIHPHPPFNWKEIDLNRLAIPAEEAIKIAEENGGRDARLLESNKCDYRLLLFPHRYDGWQVSVGSDFELAIDEHSGKIKKCYVCELISSFQTHE